MDTGVSFPFRIGTRGRVVMSEVSRQETRLIDESLEQIILTAVGERAMEVEFGSTAHSLVFEGTSDPSLDNVGMRFIREAIERWEPRINVNSVDILRKNGTIFIRIEYEVLNLGEEDVAIVELGGENNG